MAKRIVRKKPLDFEAAFDKAAMDKIELSFTGTPDGITRRAALSALTVSKSELLESMDPETAEAVFAEARALGVYVSRLKDFVELMNSAQARMFTVLDEYANAA